MKRIREYEIWNCPGHPTVDPANIAAEVARELGFTSETIVPHNQVPGPADCQKLAIALAERELSADDLAKFCSMSGYALDPDDPTVAYHFLNSAYGQSLAWVHLEEIHDDDATRSRIVLTVRRKGLALVDPENLFCFVFTE